jgi:hypothetical protein
MYPWYDNNGRDHRWTSRPDYRGGLPIARLRKIEDYVHAHLAESISIETRVYKLSHLEQISVPL